MSSRSISTRLTLSWLEVHRSRLTKVKTAKRSAEFLLTLSKGRQLSQIALNNVIKGCQSICNWVATQVKEKALVTLYDARIDPTAVPQLGHSFLAIPDPFEENDTPNLREKFYKEHFNYIVSLSIFFHTVHERYNLYIWHVYIHLYIAVLMITFHAHLQHNLSHWKSSNCIPTRITVEILNH